MVPLPGLIIVYDYARQRGRSLKGIIRSNIGTWILFSVICLAYLIFRFSITGRMSTERSWWGGSIYSNFLMMTKATALYIKLLLFPFNLNFHHMIEPVHTVFNGWVILSILTILCSVIALIYFHKRSGVIFFSLLWFYLALVPSFNIIPISYTMMAERFIYMASAGPIIAVAYGLYHIYERCKEGRRKGILSVILIGVVIIIFSFLSYQRNNVWKNEEILWSDVVSKSPESPTAHYNLGYALSKKGFNDRALEEYKQTLSLKKDYEDAHAGIGNIYLSRGQFNKALEEFGIELSMRPKHIGARRGFAGVYLKLGLVDKAISELQALIKLGEVQPGDHNNLGAAYIIKGQYNTAIEEFKKAAFIRPDYFQAHFNLGLAYVETGFKEKAIEEMQKVLKLHPNHKGARENLNMLINSQ